MKLRITNYIEYCIRNIEDVAHIILTQLLQDINLLDEILEIHLKVINVHGTNKIDPTKRQNLHNLIVQQPNITIYGKGSEEHYERCTEFCVTRPFMYKSPYFTLNVYVVATLQL